MVNFRRSRKGILVYKVALSLVAIFVMIPLGFAQEAGGGGVTLDVDIEACRTQFDTVYQEVVTADPEVAELMRAEFEAFERGDVQFGEFEKAFVEQIDRNEARTIFESAYQEAVARGDTIGAEMMKEQFEAFERGECPVVSPEAIRDDFERAYQESLAKGDTQAAEMMKQQFEAFERGDVFAASMDQEHMQAEYEKHYSEALAQGDTEVAEHMAQEFEHYMHERNTDYLTDNRNDSERARHCLENPNLPGCQVQ